MREGKAQWSWFTPVSLLLRRRRVECQSKVERCRPPLSWSVVQLRRVSSFLSPPAGPCHQFSYSSPSSRDVPCYFYQKILGHGKTKRKETNIMTIWKSHGNHMKMWSFLSCISENLLFLQRLLMSIYFQRFPPVSWEHLVLFLVFFSTKF